MSKTRLYLGILAVTLGLVGCKPASQQPGTTSTTRTTKTTRTTRTTKTTRAIRTTDAAKPAAVVVEGFAVLGADKASARQAAIANALHLAVEQKCGLFLAGSRTAENYVLVRYRVHSRTEGMIEGYKILEEAAENGIYRVKLSVTFRKDVVAVAGLDKLRFALAASGVYLDGSRRVASDEVESRVRTALAESGIKLTFVNTGLTPTSGAKAIKAAARKHRLDLIVTLKSEAKQKARLGNLILYEATVDLTALRPVTADVLATKRIRAKGQRKTSNANAAQSAEAAAAKTAGDYLLREIIRSRQGAFEVQVFVERVKSAAWLEKLRAALRAKPGVRVVELAGHRGSGAELLVSGEARVKNAMAGYLESLRGAKLKVTRQGPTYFVIRRKGL